MCNGNDFYIKNKTKLPKTLTTDLSVEKIETEKDIVQKSDILAEMTQQTKLLLVQFTTVCNLVQSWKYYR